MSGSDRNHVLSSILLSVGWLAYASLQRLTVMSCNRTQGGASPGIAPGMKQDICNSEENTGSAVFCCNSAVCWPLSGAGRFSVKRTIARMEYFILLKCIIKSKDSSLNLGELGFKFYFFWIDVALKMPVLFLSDFLNHCSLTLNLKVFLIYVLYRCQNSASKLEHAPGQGYRHACQVFVIRLYPWSLLEFAYSINQSDALEQSLQAHLSRNDRI